LPNFLRLEPAKVTSGSKVKKEATGSIWSHLVSYDEKRSRTHETTFALCHLATGSEQLPQSFDSSWKYQKSSSKELVLFFPLSSQLIKVEIKRSAFEK
jgi:outer membrane biogenesis lipoprotein LolB